MSRHCRVRLMALLGALMGCLAGAFGQAVDMALVLVIDTSGSIDQQEYRLQCAGYSAAFRNPAILTEISAGPNKAIAVSTLVFSDSVTRVMGWHLIRDEETAGKVADLLERVPRVQEGGTHIANALEAAARELSDCPYMPAAVTIDLSGDGPDNEGVPATISNPLDFLLLMSGLQTQTWTSQMEQNALRLRRLRDLFKKKGATINCVAIQDPAMKGYFQEYLTGGSGSFTLFASSFQTFSDVIKKKLFREIQAGIKTSRAVEMRKSQPAGKADAKPEGKPSGEMQKPVRPPTPGGATGVTEEKPGAMKAPPPEPKDLQSSPPAAREEMERTAVPAPEAKEVVLVVRDAESDFPLDQVVAESDPAGAIERMEEISGCPGQFLVQVRFDGHPARLTVRSPGYEPATLELPPDTTGRTQVRLARTPMKIVW